MPTKNHLGEKGAPPLPALRLYLPPAPRPHGQPQAAGQSACTAAVLQSHGSPLGFHPSAPPPHSEYYSAPFTQQKRKAQVEKQHHSSQARNLCPTSQAGPTHEAEGHSATSQPLPLRVADSQSSHTRHPPSLSTPAQETRC